MHKTLEQLLADKEKSADTDLKLKEEMDKLSAEKKAREKEERELMTEIKRLKAEKAAQDKAAADFKGRVDKVKKEKDEVKRREIARRDELQVSLLLRCACPECLS